MNVRDYKDHVEVNVIFLIPFFLGLLCVHTTRQHINNVIKTAKRRQFLEFLSVDDIDDTAPCCCDPPHTPGRAPLPLALQGLIMRRYSTALCPFFGDRDEWS